MKNKSKNPTVRLRRNFRKNGAPGSWKLRISIQRGKDRTVYLLEVGLHTRDDDEARRRADVVVHAFEAAGIHTEPQFRVEGHELAHPKMVDHSKGFQLTLL